MKKNIKVVNQGLKKTQKLIQYFQQRKKIVENILKDKTMDKYVEVNQTLKKYLKVIKQQTRVAENIVKRLEKYKSTMTKVS